MAGNAIREKVAEQGRADSVVLDLPARSRLPLAGKRDASASR